MALRWRAVGTGADVRDSAGLGAHPRRCNGGIGVWTGKLPGCGGDDIRLAGYRLRRPVVFRQGSGSLRDRLGRRLGWLVRRRRDIPRHGKRSAYQHLAPRAWPCDASHASGYGQLYAARRTQENDIIYLIQTGAIHSGQRMLSQSFRNLNKTSSLSLRSRLCHSETAAPVFFDGTREASPALRFAAGTQHSLQPSWQPSQSATSSPGSPTSWG